MTGNIQHPTPPGKPFHGATLLDQLRADCIKAGVAGREEAEAECSRLEARLRAEQDRLAVLENHQHDPDAAKRVIADILRKNQADAARRTYELVWSRIGDDNAAPEPAATKPQRRAPAAMPADPNDDEARRQAEQAQHQTQPRRRRMRRPTFVPDNVGPDQPIRLQAAAKIAFPDGSMTVSGLRNEIRKGNLQASKMAGRIYVTLNGIQQMRERCNIGAGDEARARSFTSATPSGPVVSGGGSSSTGQQPASASSAAQAHLKVIAQRLKQPLPNTSPESTSPTSAVVIPLKS